MIVDNTFQSLEKSKSSGIGPNNYFSFIFQSQFHNGRMDIFLERYEFGEVLYEDLPEVLEHLWNKVLNEKSVTL